MIPETITTGQPGAAESFPRLAESPAEPSAEPPPLTVSLLRHELTRLALRAHAAEERAQHAAVMYDQQDPAAEQERLEAAGEHHALRQDLADLFLLLLRVTAEERPEQLRLHLADLLEPTLEPLADAIASLEGRRWA